MSEDPDLEIFCNKLGIPLFSSEELFLFYGNPIVEILRYQPTHPDYNTYAKDITKMIEYFEEQQEHFLESYDKVLMEDNLKRGDFYREILSSFYDTTAAASQFRQKCLSKFLRKIPTYHHVHNNRNICIHFSTIAYAYSPDINNKSVELIMQVENHVIDENKGYLLEVIEQEEKLPETEELYNLINEFKSKLPTCDDLLKLISNNYETYFDTINKSKVVQIVKDKIEKSKNKEVNRLFNEFINKLIDDYQETISSDTNSVTLKNIFPSLGIVIYNFEFSQNAYFQFIKISAIVQNQLNINAKKSDLFIKN